MESQERYQEWKNTENLEVKLKNELESLSEEEIQEAFSCFLSFGTAGMRGILGPGTNRMNIYTVRQATEGLARLIEEEGGEALERGVVIAYDSRRMSAEFAMEAALVLGKHKIKAYVFESLRPTPTLSFAVRFLNAFAGIMITASHNPAEYNGYKVYGEDGGQMTAAHANKLTEHVNSIDNPLTIEIGDKTELLGSGQIEIIGERIDQAYLEAMKSVTVNPDLIEEMGDQIQIAYTPLHGTGLMLGMKALEQVGFTQVEVVEDQANPDGDFPTVKSPNPESPAAFDLVEQLGRSIEADILLATDPDADRLGAMIRQQDGSYSLLTGNQIAALMADYLLCALKEKDALPDNAVIVKSMVSTDLVDKIADAYDVEMVEVLTGFKYIADKIKQYEQSGSHEFILGFEESYGYLIQTFARDKDAIQAMVILAEITAYHKKHGRTLADALQAIYEKYGYFIEKTLSMTFPGQAGQAKMTQIMAKIREEGLKEIAGYPVSESWDYLKSTLTYGDGKEANIVYPKSDAIKYILEDGSWIAMRPSGTEPKIKLYIGASADSAEAVQTKANILEQALRDLIAD